MLINPDELDSGISPARFVEIVQNADDKQLVAAMADAALRDRVLNEVFRQMPERFLADKAGDMQAVVHWKIGPQPYLWAVRIEAGTCSVSQNVGNEKPTVTFTIGDVEFLRLLAGQASGTKLMVTGKLKLRGDLKVGKKIEKLFAQE